MATCAFVPVKITVCKSARKGGDGLPVMATALNGKSTIPLTRKPQANKPLTGANTKAPNIVLLKVFVSRRLVLCLLVRDVELIRSFSFL